MAIRVDVEPALLAWARDRARIERGSLIAKFPKLPEWESRDLQPTIKQLEDYAQATHTSLGFLLLQQPPVDVVPIPDFRTIGDRPINRPSADLLDTVYACQQRQDWYRDFARANRDDPVEFVGSLTVATSVVEAATKMRDALDFGLDDRRKISTWSGALDHLREKAEAVGALVMFSGVVGSNSHRKLDPDEFRGFALSDALGNRR